MKKRMKLKAAIAAANLAARKSARLAKMAATGAATRNAAKEAEFSAFLAVNRASSMARDSGFCRCIGLLIGRCTGKGKFGHFCGRWDPYYN